MQLSADNVGVDDMLRKILLERGEGRLYEFAAQLRMEPRLVVKEIEGILLAAAAGTGGGGSLSSAPPLSSSSSLPPPL